MQAIRRTIKYLHSHPIASKNRWLTYYKFIVWQMRSRINKNKLYVLPYVNNTKFVAKKNLTGITGSIYTGLQDFEEMSFLLHFLRKEDCFFDIGSNVGAYTILASGVRGAHSIAFEPNQTSFNFLKRNIELNHLQDIVICENKGVGSKKGSIKFTVYGDTTNHVISKYELDSPSVEVELVALDEYDKYSYPTLMKIDVEGFETEVIMGAKEILSNAKLKAIIIELNGSGGRYNFDELEIHRRLIDESFAPYTYEPFSRTLVEQESFGLYNTIYIRDLPTVSERVRTSEKFNVWNMNI